MQLKKVIIDCDPGIDDAAAIIMALKHTDIEVIGITTVAGNAPLENTTDNTLKILELCEEENIPVYCGSEKPLQHTLPDYEETMIFGRDGLGDICLPLPSIKAKEGAEDFILEMAENTEELYIISIGPMTNLAKAVMKNQKVFCKLAGVYSMGGAILTGNVTAVAEFNYWVDPEAANIVYQSGVTIHMLGLNVTEEVMFTKEHQQLLLEGNAVTKTLGEMLTALFHYEELNSGRNEVALHDILAVAALVQPELFEWVNCHVDISMTNVTRGECLIDLVDAWGWIKNCNVALKVDSDKLIELFFHTVLPGTDVVGV